MSILFVITRPDTSEVFVNLTKACARKCLPYMCFFTGSGASQLSDDSVVKATKLSIRSVVCEHSWQKFFGDASSVIEEGSQTTHSELIGQADKVVSL